MSHVAGNHEIETASGRFVDVRNPDPDTIVLEDIAHHLAHICRFTGACSRFYSVAEHAVLVADRLVELGAHPRVALAGLHHDDAEAYLNDVARPLKGLLHPAYRDLTIDMDAAITRALGIETLLPGPEAASAIRAADEWALAAEAYHLLPSRGAGWFCHGLYDASAPGPARHGLGVDTGIAFDAYLNRHRQLTIMAEAIAA